MVLAGNVIRFQYQRSSLANKKGKANRRVRWDPKDVLLSSDRPRAILGTSANVEDANSPNHD